MEILNLFGWTFYMANIKVSFDPNKCGKWMFFTKDLDRAKELCTKAIEENICLECKHGIELREYDSTVCCFYQNGDDIECHKRIIKFMLDNNMIQHTKTGKLYNIGFKYDNQTSNMEYGNDFKASIRLSDFVDLKTGEFLDK